MDKPLTTTEIRRKVADSGLTTSKIFRMMADFGIKRPSSAGILKKFEPGSEDKTRASVGPRQAMTEFFERWGADESGKPNRWMPPVTTEDDSFFLQAPLTIPVIGQTFGANIVFPVDVWSPQKAIHVPLFAPETRWREGEVSLAAVIFAVAYESPAIKNKIATPNEFTNGWAAIIDQDLPLAIEKVWRGQTDRFWAVIKLRTNSSKELIQRGAAKTPGSTPTVIAQIQPQPEGKVNFRDGNGKTFAVIDSSELEKIYPVICWISHY
tara:strand:- start:1797 stop:2594 length:798 start_codon:yes stop_codon:yes gene_type:complete